LQQLITHGAFGPVRSPQSAVRSPQLATYVGNLESLGWGRGGGLAKRQTFWMNNDSWQKVKGESKAQNGNTTKWQTGKLANGQTGNWQNGCEANEKWLQVPQFHSPHSSYTIDCQK